MLYVAYSKLRTEDALADDSDSPSFLFSIFLLFWAYHFSTATVISALLSGIPTWGPLIAILDESEAYQHQAYSSA